MSNNNNIQLIQYKIIHRVHFTGHRMFKMGFTQSSTCTHCSQNTQDTYLHALWNCTPVQHFWAEITTLLTNILDCHIPLSPSLCLLGDLTIVNLNPEKSKSLLVALTIAKKTILMNWKSKHTITISHWKNLLLDYISLDKLSSSTKQNSKYKDSTWQPFINSINSS